MWPFTAACFSNHVLILILIIIKLIEIIKIYLDLVEGWIWWFCALCVFAAEPNQRQAEESPVHVPSPSPELSSQPVVSPEKRQLPCQTKALQRRCYRLKKKVSVSSEKTSRKMTAKMRREKLIADLSEHLPGAAPDFVTTRIRMGRKKRMNWSDKDKCSALSLYHISPKAYMLVTRIFALPSVSTLRRAMRKVKIYLVSAKISSVLLKRKFLLRRLGQSCVLRCLTKCH